MKVFVLDDEPLAVKRLTRLLAATGRVEVAGSSNDPVEALHRIQTLGVEALFLDIEMPELNGFDLLARLPPGVEPLVVFTTAYDRYALQAFEVNSVDYLLKPVEPAKLDRALARLDRMLGGSEPRVDLGALIRQMQRALGEQGPEPLTRIPSRLGDRVELVETAQVTHFFAKDKLTYAATASRVYTLDHTITDLEQRLDPRRFLRIHRATLVNADYIKELYTWFNGRLVVRLKDGKTELQVARDRVADLKQRLGLA